MARPEITFRVVAGSVLLTEGQARMLTDGGTIEIEHRQFYRSVDKGAQIGDLVWVQEPYSSYTPKRAGYQYGVLVGPPGRARRPAGRRVDLCDSIHRRESGRRLTREQSCVTLAIEAIEARKTVRCRIRICQVDKLIAEQERRP